MIIFTIGNLFLKKLKKDDWGVFDLSRYSFKSKNNDKYFVRIFHYIKHSSFELFKDFVSIDFMEEGQYNKQKDNFEINDYKNTKKFDAIKVLNTVFSLVKKYISENDIEVFSCDCDNERYKIYKYFVDKYFRDYIYVEESSPLRAGETQMWLYSPDKFILDDKTFIMRRKDNSEIKFKAK